MKKLELKNFGVLEMNAKSSVEIGGGDTGYRPGISFGDSYWFGPSGGYSDSSGFHPDRPADWVDIYFGQAAY
ncbi:hypothetical protein HDC90_000697 [Pedobacter sp. AK013]|uniref:hypothetical protein n=1 Tax=Pedobacter sp. AK013 TaxID=2723071 RepID=UPI001609F436|nr:hypothetical protein [Pedobacter sp. AK013]MBB6236091.1 hypothetical protein [Pedobacter sp. AK013]